MAVVIIVHPRFGRAKTTRPATIVTPTRSGTWTEVGWRSLESHEIWLGMRSARPQDRPVPAR